MAHWLMKSEPYVFSYDDLIKVKREGWDGVRNYQARNFMREMKKGDLVIFYHSTRPLLGLLASLKSLKRLSPTRHNLILNRTTSIQKFPGTPDGTG